MLAKIEHAFGEPEFEDLGRRIRTTAAEALGRPAVP